MSRITFTLVSTSAAVAVRTTPVFAGTFTKEVPEVMLRESDVEILVTTLS